MKECKKRNIPEDEIGNGEFLIYYETVMEELSSWLNILQTYQDISITPVTVFTEYVLNSDYGFLKSYKVNFGSDASALDLELVDLSQVPTIGNLTSGTPNRISIYPKDDGLHYVYLYPLSGFTGTLRIFYKQLSYISAGGGAGASLAGTSVLADRYFGLLVEGLLAQMFDDKMSIFMIKLQNASYLNATPTKGNIDYSLGGIDDDTPDNGFSKNFNGEC
jgi:hypothetical protein